MSVGNKIYECARKKGSPLLAAHRGVCGANVPCNTLLAYEIAVAQGADIVEIDVAKSADGQFFAFHPGMEHAYLKTGKRVCEMSADEAASVSILNNDEIETHYRIPALKDVLALLKGRAFINVDKYWTDIAGITEEIRAAGVQDQVIVKSIPEEKYLREIERVAPDLMYMSMVWHKDNVTDKLLERDINYIGTEALFDKLTDDVASERYIGSMHEKGLIVWSNAIVYDEREIISAGLTDDISLEKGGDHGWGKLGALGFDVIQTDWLLPASLYFKSMPKR